jgi:hypothetical protein
MFTHLALSITRGDVAFAQSMAGTSPVHVTPSPFNLMGDTEYGEGVRLQLDLLSYEEVKEAARLQITNFPLGPERAVDLDLTRFSVTGPHTRFVMATDQGETLISPPDVVTLRGSVVGHPESEVYLGLSPYCCNGFLTLEGERYILAAKPGLDHEGRQLDCAVYRQNSIRWDFNGPWCRTRYSPPATPPVPVRERELEGEFEGRPQTYRICDVAVDTDHEYCDDLFDGNVWAATAYTVELWAAASVIYDRELSVKLRICFLRIFTGSDPWNIHGVEDFAMEELKGYWLIYMDDVDRTIVHRHCGWTNRGGLAWEWSLCNDEWGYAITCVTGSFGYPLEPSNDSWDLAGVIHEVGHNFGSQHTHCYDPPIDHCWNCESCDTTCVPPDCFGCPGCPDPDVCYHGPIDCTYGTIMSYCDGCSPDSLENKSYSFHERVLAEKIRPHIEEVTCMPEGRDPVYVDWRNSGSEDGSEQFPFRRVRDAVRTVLPEGTIFIKDGYYSDSLVIWHPMMLRHNGAAGEPVIILGE